MHMQYTYIECLWLAKVVISFSQILLLGKQAKYK